MWFIGDSELLLKTPTYYFTMRSYYVKFGRIEPLPPPPKHRGWGLIDLEKGIPYAGITA
jgi:hypothetical protein